MAHESGYPERGQRAATTAKKNGWHNPGAYADMIRKKSTSKGSAPIGGAVGGGS